MNTIERPTTTRIVTYARIACPLVSSLGAQAYISRARMESFSLIADLNYVSQNAPRICRALFEICLRRGWSSLADLALTISKASHAFAHEARRKPVYMIRDPP